MMISSCQVQQCAGWLYRQVQREAAREAKCCRLPRRLLWGLACGGVFAQCGLAVLVCESSWSKQLPRVPLFPAAWLYPGTHPWGLGVSQWWLEEHTCPLGWGLCKGSFLEAFQHLRDFAVFTDWEHSSVSLRCFQVFFALAHDMPPTLHWILPKGLVCVLQGQFGDSALLPATSGSLWTVSEGCWCSAGILVLYLLVYQSTAFTLRKAATGHVQVVQDIF